MRAAPRRLAAVAQAGLFLSLKALYHMGYSMSWVAMKGRNPDQFLSAMELSRAGQCQGYDESAMAATLLPSGWFLVLAKGCDHPILRGSTLAAAAQPGSRLIACSIEEQVMYSSAEEWRGGRQVWRIEHEAQRGLMDLNVVGDLPRAAGNIRKAFAKLQSEAGGETAKVDHYFKIPLHIAKDIVGFKHDEDLERLSHLSFEALVDDPLVPPDLSDKVGLEARRSWWRFWK